jgi:hypothetical protein
MTSDEAVATGTSSIGSRDLPFAGLLLSTLNNFWSLARGADGEVDV